MEMTARSAAQQFGSMAMTKRAMKAAPAVSGLREIWQKLFEVLGDGISTGAGVSFGQGLWQ
jgi:hypothetical protein